MKTYFSNLIPQILSYSKKLDSSSILTKHHWTVIDETNSEKTVFIFRQKDNQLLISRNGNVEKGTWELIDHNTLLIDTKTESRMFKHGFADSSVLALKVDGKTEYAFLIDEDVVPEAAKTLNGLLEYLENKYLIIKEKEVIKIQDKPKINIESQVTKQDPVESNINNDDTGLSNAMTFLILFIIIIAIILVYANN
nr:hypothetical protein [uncultured Marinifilum sp.]